MDDMRIFQYRLKSYGNRGCNWPHKHFRATGLRLAQVGFYYDSRGIYNDNVTCYLCNRSYYGWKKDDVPMEIHKKISPQCPLVIILDYSKKWVSNPSENSNYEPESSTLMKARLATFKNWWPHNYPNITAERIAEAGLYYAPDVDSEDKVECAYCKAKFDYWTSNDNPRNKHFRFKEKCPFFCATQLKRRKLKRLQNKEKNNNPNNKKTKKEKETEIDDIVDNNDNSEDDDNESEVEVKKTYNTRYSTREIKKVNYVEEDTDDELFSSEESNSQDDDEDDEKNEESEDNEVNEEDDEYREMEDDSILIDTNENKTSNSDSSPSEEEKLSKKIERKMSNKNDNKKNNIKTNNNDINIDNNNKSKEEIDSKNDTDIKDSVNDEKEDAKNIEPIITISKKDIQKLEKEDDEKREKSIKTKSDDEYIKSSNSDYSYASSSYEEMLRKRSSAKKKKQKKIYKKKKRKSMDDSFSLDDDDELDSEEERLRTKEIRKLLSTENGYLGPLPKIKSKIVIEEEKKLYEEMKRRAEENESSDFDIENTNPEFVSVTSILRKRKKEHNNEFGFISKRMSLSIKEPEAVINSEHQNNNTKEENITNNDDSKNKIKSPENDIKNDMDVDLNNDIHGQESLNEINSILVKTPITIQKVKKEKDFTIVKILNTVDQSTEKQKNLLETISKQKIEDIFKNTPIKLVDRNQLNIKNTPLNFSEEDLSANNLFVIDDETNLDLLKEKIIEILLEKSKKDSENLSDTEHAYNDNENRTFLENEKTNKNENANANKNENMNKNENENSNEKKSQNEIMNKNENVNENETVNKYDNVNENKNENKNENENKHENENNSNEFINNCNMNDENDGGLDLMDVDEPNIVIEQEVIEDDIPKNEIEVIEILDDSSDEETKQSNVKSIELAEEKNQFNKNPNNINNDYDKNKINHRIEEEENSLPKINYTYEEIEENIKDEETTNMKKKAFYEIKSSDKKILKELSFSITTPEPNSPKINSVSGKSDNGTFKTPLSSQVKNFHLSSDISLEETVEALLSTPTPLPLGLNSKSYLKNDKELLMKTIIEENRKSIKKLDDSSKSLPKQSALDTAFSNENKKTDNTNSNKFNKKTAIIPENEENISFMSYNDNNMSYMFRNDDSIIIRSKQKPEDNIEKIVDTIQKLKATIETVNDVSMLVLDSYENKDNSNNKVLIDNEFEDVSDKMQKNEEILSNDKSSGNSINEEEILDSYFNHLINTPNSKSSEKSKSTKKVIEIDDDILSLTVGQYLEKVNKNIAKKLRIDGEEKIREYYKQLFNIEDLYIQYLDKMVNQLQEYPKDKKILESQTKLMKNTLNNDRKNVKMGIETSTDSSENNSSPVHKNI